MCTDNGILKGQRKDCCPTGKPVKNASRPSDNKELGLAELVREIEKKTSGKEAGKK